MLIYRNITEKQLLRAVADPIRRDILKRLMPRPMTAGNIVKGYSKLSQPAVSQHLKVLIKARLVNRHRFRRLQAYSLDPFQLRQLHHLARELLQIQNRQLGQKDPIRKTNPR